jgi:hypothetical protein
VAGRSKNDRIVRSLTRDAVTTVNVYFVCLRSRQRPGRRRTANNAGELIVTVHDSKDPSGPALVLGHEQWRTFIRRTWLGEFDRPLA